jgi:hypothetical protein
MWKLGREKLAKYYPQFEIGKARKIELYTKLCTLSTIIPVEKRTDVLLENHKVYPKLKKSKKVIDFLIV